MNHQAELITEVSTDESAFLVSDRQVRSFARLSDRLTESMIEEAMESGRDLRPGRATRADGWTPDRIRRFLEMLAQCGVVADAARAAGMNPRHAYTLRSSSKGRAFAVAWDAAQLLARGCMADEVMSRALNGCVEVIIRDGKVWGERHRYDNRLSMAVLTRLDALANSHQEPDCAPRAVAQEFGEFVDIVCTGDDAAAADFIEDRRRLLYREGDEASVLRRNGDYARRLEQLGKAADDE